MFMISFHFKMSMLLIMGCLKVDGFDEKYIEVNRNPQADDISRTFKKSLFKITSSFSC